MFSILDSWPKPNVAPPASSMSQKRISFVLSELSSQDLRRAPDMPVPLPLPFPTNTCSAPGSNAQPAPPAVMQHAIAIGEPPALPKGRGRPIAACIFFLIFCWFVGTLVAAVAFVTGRTTFAIETQPARLPRFERTATSRACTLKTRIADVDASMAEVKAGLALTIGASLQVDSETTASAVGRRVVELRFSACDPGLVRSVHPPLRPNRCPHRNCFLRPCARFGMFRLPFASSCELESVLASSAFEAALQANLFRMRGARIAVVDGPTFET